MPLGYSMNPSIFTASCLSTGAVCGIGALFIFSRISGFRRTGREGISLCKHAGICPRFLCEVHTLELVPKCGNLQLLVEAIFWPNGFPRQSGCGDVNCMTCFVLSPMFLASRAPALSFLLRVCCPQQGHRRGVGCYSWVLRNFVRIVAMLLFVVGILVNYDIAVGNDRKAGGTG